MDSREDFLGSRDFQTWMACQVSREWVRYGATYVLRKQGDRLFCAAHGSFNATILSRRSQFLTAADAGNVSWPVMDMYNVSFANSHCKVGVHSLCCRTPQFRG